MKTPEYAILVDRKPYPKFVLFFFITFCFSLTAPAHSWSGKGNITIYSGGSIWLLVTDESGQQTGWIPEKTAIVREIPDSNYFDDRTVDRGSFYVLYLDNLSESIIKLTVIGKDEGPFHVDFLMHDWNYKPAGKRITGNIVGKRLYDYKIHYSPDPEEVRNIVPWTYMFHELTPSIEDSKNAVIIGNPITVSFTISRRDEKPANDIQAKLLLQRIVDGKPAGKPSDANSASKKHQDNLFRYDPEKKKYVFPLDTSNLEPGDWELIVRLDDGSTQSTLIRIE